MRPRRSILGVPCLFGMACLVAAAGSLCAVTDDFDDDPALNSDWEVYQPLGASGVTLEHEEGIFRAIFPSGIVLDHWTVVDNATQLRRMDIPEDFVMETRVHFAGSGDPSSPTWPPAAEYYQAALMVYFNQYDVFYWGQYMGTNLRLERSGINGMCDFNPNLQDVSLQVKKVGTVYSFSWRETDDDIWNFVCSREATEAPVYAGYVFKTWGGGLGQQETFEYDYFTLEEIPEEAPEIIPLCPLGDPDVTWTGMPYARAIAVTGFPDPAVAIRSGPRGLTYDPALRILSGWTPESTGTVAIELEATNSAGTDFLGWEVKVEETSLEHDEEFDELPEFNADYWELYVMQAGIDFFILDEDESSWWRLQVPQLGSLGVAFDHWVGVDNAPQLRHAVGDAEGDFFIETKLRFPTDGAPPPADPAIAGILVYFSQYDCMYWTAGQERVIGGNLTNLLLERSGINNMAHGYFPDLLTGAPVALGVEKRCDTYSFFHRGEGETQWTLDATYNPGLPPAYVGLIMKTWGGGAAFSVDFDYFSYLELGGTVTPENCTNKIDDDGDTRIDCEDEDCAGDPSCQVGPKFLRGDPNDDGNVNITDGIYVLNFLFLGGAAPTCRESADANDDGGVNITDGIYILNYLFLGGADPVAPGPAGKGIPCGPDPENSPQNLGCESYTKC